VVAGTGFQAPSGGRSAWKKKWKKRKEKKRKARSDGAMPRQANWFASQSEPK
jgi:hypothetical protein